MRRSLRACTSLPAPMRAGLVLLLAGAGLDLVYHAPFFIEPASLDVYFGANGFLAHFVTFLGMAVTLFGVVAAGLAQAVRRSGRSRGPAFSSRHPLSRGKEN